MVDQAESADERALRRELQVLAKKRENLNSSKRQGSGSAFKAVAGRGSVFARLGGESTRAGRQVFQPMKNNTRGNTSWRPGKRDNEDARQGNTAKRQKLHSAVTRPEGVHHSEGRVEVIKSGATATSPSANGVRTQERKQRAVAPYAQKDGIARSRRMFGALMGHLGKAKQQIEKDTDLFKRQDTKQQEAEQREKAQSKNLEDRARQEAEIARLEALVMRTELDRSEQIARAKLEHLQMVRKSESQSKFLVTIASPPIYYLPARHTKETKELVAASMEAHEAKMKAREQSHEEKLRQLEAEFATKLEHLREDLEASKKNEEEAAADEQAPSDKEDDTMENEDQDMDQSPKEDEEHRRGNANEHCHDSPATEFENKDIVQESESGSEADDNPATESSNHGGEDDCAASAKPESQDGDEKKQSASPEETADTDHMDTEQSALPEETADSTGTGDIDTEPSSSSRANENVDLEQEDLDQRATTSVTKAKLTGDDDLPSASDDSKPDTRVKRIEDPAANVDKMKVAKLRAELKKRGLDTKGLKAKLVQRLKQAMHEEDESK